MGPAGRGAVRVALATAVVESGSYYGPTALGTSAAAGIGGVLAK